LAAIVEDVGPGVPSISFMDYLERGQELVLGASGWIEIGYLGSCVHEKVTGGVVRIGMERSEVTGGVVERRQVQCDRQNLIVTESQAERAAGSAQRGAAHNGKSIPVGAGAELRLQGAAPLIVADGLGEVTISRPFGSRDRQTLKLDASNGRGSYDFARHGRALTPGAVYRATFGDRSIVFRIDRDAPAGSTDILGRLILFLPDRP
jgi:hypothetical protein